MTREHDYVLSVNGPFYETGKAACKLSVCYVPRTSGLLVPQEVLRVQGTCFDTGVVTHIGALTQAAGTVIRPGEMSKGTVLLEAANMGRLDVVDPATVVGYYNGFAKAHSSTEPQLLQPLPDELNEAFLDAYISFRPGDWETPTGLYM